MRKITMFVSILCLTTLLFGAGINEGQFADQSNPEYLEHYFGITLPSASVEFASFERALNQLSGAVIEINEQNDIFKALVAAADLTELALTYSPEKASSRLAFHGISSEVPQDVQPYLACALDASLLPPSVAEEIIGSSPLASLTAANLLMSIANANGVSRNYIGNVQDSDILMRISNAFDSYTLFSDNNLDAIGAEAVQRKASTGYNLKKDADDAQFLSSRTIQYGHSDETHLKQLVVLLASEGMDAKLQIEPKVSIYEYLLDWGPVPEPSPYYMVLENSEDFYLAYAVEYDAKFEFEKEEDLLKFDQIINTYAKKNDKNQAKDSNIALLRGAWWQPLYSTTFNADPQAYQEIVDCILMEDGYSIHPFSLLENKNNLINTLKDLSGLEVHEKALFVNNAFYRYLTGADYQ
ncbi:hypothetical protein [uncultured Sphaerochaeta sp.]|uniref:hypothetical protein n=1 Tax=uncultured Sphaerochaeta sp. TaxID=886478 RepID=UPI002AA93C49|nr:hypothetical protein [uncultured Sphaerochaeta sp.]